MLEITLLKVNHFGERQARKLLPYIMDCDAFSQEAFGLTEDSATENEKNWRDLIESEISRSRVVSTFCPGEDKHPRVLEYLMKVSDYLFRQKRPQFYTERWRNSGELMKMRRLAEEGSFVEDRGLTKISQGDYEEGISLFYEGVKKIMASSRMRDKNIAGNLGTAEGILRANYPRFADKNKIKLTLELGSFHRPEKYTSLPIKVVYLHDSGSYNDMLKLQEASTRLIRRGISLSRLTPLLRKRLEQKHI